MGLEFWYMYPRFVFYKILKLVHVVLSLENWCEETFINPSALWPSWEEDVPQYSLLAFV